jgi:hypothetical protein
MRLTAKIIFRSSKDESERDKKEKQEKKEKKEKKDVANLMRKDVIEFDNNKITLKAVNYEYFCVIDLFCQSLSGGTIRETRSSRSLRSLKTSSRTLSSSVNTKGFFSIHFSG